MSDPGPLRVLVHVRACAQAQRSSQELTDYSKMHLASLNLPAALEALQTSSGLPNEVWNHVKDAQFKGGVNALNELYSR